MRLSVELKGLARRVSRAKEVMVEVSNGATLGDVVVAHREGLLSSWVHWRCARAPISRTLHRQGRGCRPQ